MCVFTNLKSTKKGNKNNIAIYKFSSTYITSTDYRLPTYIYNIIYKERDVENKKGRK